MICPPCRTAGRLNKAANDYDADWHRQAAASYHAECEHPSTCPCHHHVGQVINKQPGR